MSTFDASSFWKEVCACTGPAFAGEGAAAGLPISNGSGIRWGVEVPEAGLHNDSVSTTIPHNARSGCQFAHLEFCADAFAFVPRLAAKFFLLSSRDIV